MPFFHKKSLILFTLFILTITESRSQSDFRPGYIISLQGDSINGFINYRNDKRNTEECIFKKEIKNEPTIYKPEQIRSYGFIDGKYYISNNHINLEAVPKNTFLEYLFNGSMSIYYYRDNSQGHYLVAKDTLAVELNHLVKSSDLNGSILTKSNRYKDQLKYIAQDHPNIFGKIDKVSCDKEGLIFIAKEYQKLCCPHENYIQYNKKGSKSVSVNYGLFGALGISNFKSPPYNLNKGNSDPTILLDFEQSTTYEIGAMLNLHLNFIEENRAILQFTPSINFASYSSLTEKTVAPFINTFKTDIELTTLKIPLIFKYSFYNSNSNFFPNLRFGAGNAIFIKQEGTHEYRSRLIDNENQPETTNKDDIDFSGTRNTFLIIGTGLDIKLGKNLLLIGLTYESGVKMLESTRSDVQLNVGIQF